MLILKKCIKEKHKKLKIKRDQKSEKVKNGKKEGKRQEEGEGRGLENPCTQYHGIVTRNSLIYAGWERCQVGPHQ